MPGYLTHVEYSEKHDFTIAFQTNTDQGLGKSNHAHVQHFAQLIICFLNKIKAADERAILDNFKKQETCWNEGSVDCYMTAYLPSDSIRTISRNGVTYGYENIRKNYLKYFPPGKMGKLYFSNLNLTRLSDEYYYVVGRFNLKFPERDEPVRGSFSVIMQKINGQWWMVSDHSG